METQETKQLPSNEVVIITQSRQDRFEINGNIYDGINDLFPEKAIVIQGLNYKFDVYLDKFGNTVLRKCELYPCFDSSDRMYENRYYISYLICTSKDEAIEKYNYILEHNSNAQANEYTPSFLAPLVYTDDGKTEIRIMIFR